MTIELTWKRAFIAIAAIGFFTLAFSWSGVMSIAASSGQYAPVEWFLPWAMPNAVRTQSLAVDQPPVRELDDAGRVKEALEPCAICHGTSGAEAADGALPGIAGMPEPYLFATLCAFRSGHCNSGIMAAAAAGSSLYGPTMRLEYGENWSRFPTPSRQSPIARRVPRETLIYPRFPRHMEVPPLLTAASRICSSCRTSRLKCLKTLVRLLANSAAGREQS
jgi:cytochrome c553